MPENSTDEELREAIHQRLAGIIDPGAGLDVFRMGLVRKVEIGEGGGVSFTFRPSSPVCPMAFSLAPAIKEAIESLPGVSGVRVRIENFNRAEELQALLDPEGDA
jgi:metal-sulfur cluster biosynthetic enzyme